MSGPPVKNITNDPVQQAWLRRRRDMVAAASKRDRDRKKQEREELQQDNAALRQEREQLLERISQLQREAHPPAAVAAAAAPPPPLHHENAELRRELASHEAFLSSVFAQLPKVDPASTPKMAELSRENRDTTMLHFMRLLAESQENRSGRWRMADMDDGVMRFSKPTRVLARHCAVDNNGNNDDDGGLINLRHPQAVASAMVKSWVDRNFFAQLFGEGFMTALKELVDFRVEHDRETLSAFYRKLPALDPSQPYLYKDMVYFVANGTCTLAKSSLDVGLIVPVDLPLTISCTAAAAAVLPALELGSDMLAEHDKLLRRQGHQPPPPSQELVTTVTTTTTTTRKRQRQTTTPPKAVAPQLFGVTECYFSLRTLTEHGDSGEADDDADTDTVRISSGPTDGVFAWRDEDEGKTCVVWMMTVPGHLSRKFDLQQELQERNSLGPKMTMILGRLVEAGFLSG